MDKHELKQNQVPRAAQETANKENASSSGGPRTPPRKAPAARDKLKPVAMPKALKI